MKEIMNRKQILSVIKAGKKRNKSVIFDFENAENNSSGRGVSCPTKAHQAYRNYLHLYGTVVKATLSQI